jgi:hypothetical protein
MFRKDYQVLNIDYAIAEWRRADTIRCLTTLVGFCA